MSFLWKWRKFDNSLRFATLAKFQAYVNGLYFIAPMAYHVCVYLRIKLFMLKCTMTETTWQL